PGGGIAAHGGANRPIFKDSNIIGSFWELTLITAPALRSKKRS
ncbi:MAG: hypothetical protein QOE52_1970, partial [Mycobacterium sp.]|nr:hypothetical protein [Mycobacterium sp.]